ncbi:alpha/beta-hydrolase [Hortaea werneckii]|nr:alpha/beta-hydrolase [Hortaea werneckii]KAI7366714.1 alpha/beta-hydrolase [Hortaea werneckii]
MLSVDSVITVLTPPALFLGLLVGLWTYKCVMTVIFQEKFIYMPYMPPFARSEKIEDYEASCKPVEWVEERIRSLDGTKISLAVGRVTGDEDSSQRHAALEKATHITRRKEVIVCYFQGNGSSTPPRLPLLSQVMKLLHARRQPNVQYTLVALSYRGFWTSSGKPTEPGIQLDAQALLKHLETTYGSKPGADIEIILWGQSVGAGVAATAAATYLTQQRQAGENSTLPVTGLIMETPFTSIKSMLFALYPQKWLPYQYLHPFLRNHWNNEMALRRLAGVEVGKRPPILFLPATRDEVVPPSEVEKLKDACTTLGLQHEMKGIIGALHTEATTRREGQEAVAKFIEKASIS